MKILFIFLLLLMMKSSLFGAGSTTFGNIYSEDGGNEDAQSRFLEFLGSLNLRHFEESFEMDFSDWEACSNGGALSIPGIAGCYDEPLYLADYAKEPLKIQSLGISLNDDPEKSGYTRKSEDSFFAFGHTNIIVFPILSMAIDSRWLCLEDGSIGIVYLSGFDPLYDGMFTQQLFVDITMFFKPEFMMIGAIDCASSSVQNFLPGLSTAGNLNDRLRMSIPHYIGCWNTFPMGGWSQSNDPIIGGGTAISYGLAASMKVGSITKSIKLDGLDGSLLPNTMCGPRASIQAFVKPQFFFQLVYPTPSEVVPMGAIPSEWAEFKNKPNSVDNSAFWIFKRKCLYFGAASCSVD